MKIRVIYIVISLLLIFFLVKYLQFATFSTKITIDKNRPLIDLKQIINLDNRKVTYLNSFYYKGRPIGFNALVNGQYITVTKLGKVNENFNVTPIFKQPSSNKIIGLPPSDINDKISRYMDFSSFPFKIESIQYYTNGTQIKSYNINFKEIVVNSSNIDISFDKKLLRHFGYVCVKQTMSLSFVNYQNDLYILNTHPVEKNNFTSLHDLVNNSHAGARF